MILNFNPGIDASRRKGLFLAALLATVGAGALAQSTTSGGPVAAATGARGQHMGRLDGARMQAMVAKHQAELKAKLMITTAQEGAWTRYTAAMQPPASMGMRPTDAQRAEMDQLSTPERIDKMRAMRSERMTQMNAQMDNRGNAAKSLYAALTPEQQKVFDTEYQKRSERYEQGRRGGDRGS